jgi:hypothetical protein
LSLRDEKLSLISYKKQVNTAGNCSLGSSRYADVIKQIFVKDFDPFVDKKEVPFKLYEEGHMFWEDDFCTETKPVEGSPVEIKSHLYNEEDQMDVPTHECEWKPIRLVFGTRIRLE